MPPPNTDYTTVTEAPGNELRREALDMLWTRYAYATSLCAGKIVLEVGCGAGPGLGMLSRAAKRVVGGDYTQRLLQLARHHYGSRVPLVRLDAHQLPFVAATFDVIILYEAIYYLDEPARFLQECRRLLTSGGVVLICSANRANPDFNPSPYSTRYWSADELRLLFSDNGFAAELLGAFPARPKSARDLLISLLKRLAVAFHLIPKTMSGKTRLKRLFFGKLESTPFELMDGSRQYRTPVSLGPKAADADYQVVFALARLT
jgi:SAM-dependent methyltransferase